MNTPSEHLYHVSEGPGLLAPYRAVAAIFNQKDAFRELSQPISPERIARLVPFLPQQILERVTTGHHMRHAAALIEGLTLAFQEHKGPLDLQSYSVTSEDSKCVIVVEFVSRQGGLLALKMAVELVLHLFDRSSLSQDDLKNRCQTMLHTQQQLQPNQTTRVMLKAARKFGIPYYPLLDSTALIAYGQGRHSVLINGGSTQFDSSIGVSIQRNKSETSRFITMMGYPVPQQLMVRDVSTAVRAATSLGYPVAVKPLAEGQGRGVTSDVRTPEDLVTAFHRAAAYSQGSVLVEKHIEGQDHRITVNGGKVIGAICRMPARVTGDGQTAIRALIARENSTRSPELKRQGLLKDIEIDDNLRQSLKNHQLDVDSIPAPGQEVFLRSNANISTGGTFHDVMPRIHPDNLQMAVDIARAFRLDSMGLDFMTTDIAVSWQQRGAVIEVNATPALLEELAEQVLTGKFSKNNNGRIPATLVISDNPAPRRGNSTDGYTTTRHTWLEGQERELAGKSLYQRCLALLIDPACDTITVYASHSDLLHNGLPLDHFDICRIDEATRSGQVVREELARNGGLARVLKPHCSQLEFF